MNPARKSYVSINPASKGYVSMNPASKGYVSMGNESMSRAGMCRAGMGRADMNYAKAGVFFFICWLVQATLLWRIWPFGAAPSLVLCASVCFAWLYDANYSLVYAIVFGLLTDIQTQALLGPTALALVLCCVPAYLLRLYFNPERALPAVFAALAATLVYVFALLCVCHAAGAVAGLPPAMRTLPGLLASHAIICFLMHILFVRTIIRHRGDRRYSGGII